MCGEVVFLFDVLGDVFNLEGILVYCILGEVERILVLFLIMFCNCGKGILIFLDEVMLRKILKINFNFCLVSCINSVLEEM